jgi:hypothetical protein
MSSSSLMFNCGDFLMVDLMLNSSISRPEALFSSPDYFRHAHQNLESSHPSTLAINILIKNVELISRLSLGIFYSAYKYFRLCFSGPSINEVVCVLIGSNTRTRYPYPDRQANPLFFPEPKTLLSSYLIRPSYFVREGKKPQLFKIQ